LLTDAGDIHTPWTKRQKKRRVDLGRR